MVSVLWRSTWILFSSLAVWATLVAAQSLNNPVISQIMRTYNDYGPIDNGATNHFIAISQDFQTVNAVNEGNVSSRRFLFDFSYCCNSSNVTFSSLQQNNNNNLLYPPIQGSAIVALIQRGGGCNWSEKLAVARNLSSANGLNLTAIIIANNITKASVEYKIYTLDNVGKDFNESTPLPSDHNVTNMLDNDIQGIAAIPVYFVPKGYGDYLRNLIANTKARYDSSRILYQLTFAIMPYWVQTTSSKGSGLSGTYIACIIVLVSVFVGVIVVSVVLLRWWRRCQLREQMEYEAQLITYANNMRLRMKAKPLPLDLVNTIPIARYSPETVTNNSCAICFEDYVVDKNELRILGCGHGFCILCIEPWLTQKSTKCPICKYDCLPPERRHRYTSPAPLNQPSTSEENVPENAEDGRQPSGRDDQHQPLKQVVIESVEHNKDDSDTDQHGSPHDQQTILRNENKHASSCSSAIIEPSGLRSEIQPVDGEKKNVLTTAIADNDPQPAATQSSVVDEREEPVNDTTTTINSHFPDTTSPDEMLVDAKHSHDNKS